MKKKKWDGFVETLPQGNIFCTTPFLDALAEDYDLVLIEENNQLKMGAIILKQNGKPIKAPYPFTGFVGCNYFFMSKGIPKCRSLVKPLSVPRLSGRAGVVQ